MEKLVVALAVLLAALFLVRRIYRMAKKPGCPECSGYCADCGQMEINKKENRGKEGI